jgi:hypothetical protein
MFGACKPDSSFASKSSNESASACWTDLSVNSDAGSWCISGSSVASLVLKLGFFAEILSSSLPTTSLRRALALLEPSGISTEKALVLLMSGGGVAMKSV